MARTVERRSPRSREGGAQGTGPELTSCFRSAAGWGAYLSAYDAALALWTAPFEEFEIPGRRCSTHAIASGPPEAPPLIMLHGAGMGSTMWFPTVGALSQRHRVYALDTPGDAGKSLMSEPLSTRAASASWLVEVLDRLGIERAAVAGLSYGGWLALNFALHAPARVSRLALLAPAASLCPFSLRFYVTFSLMAPLAFSAPTLRRLIGAFSADRGRIPAELHRQLWETRQARPRICPPTVFSDDELRALSTRTLLLVGEREIIYPPRRALERAKRQIASVEAELVPGAGHLLNIDQPEHVNARLRQFLECA